jgi:hypothetical protein
LITPTIKPLLYGVVGMPIYVITMPIIFEIGWASNGGGLLVVGFHQLLMENEILSELDRAIVGNGFSHHQENTGNN